MHRYRIVAQISLILSILNLVLAAPIVVQEIHEARDDDEPAVAEDEPKKWHELGAASDRSTSPPPFPDAIASPQHSSSSYPSPYLSSDSSVSGYSWLLDRPPRLSANLPSSSPHPSSSGSSEMPPPWWLQLEGSASETPPSSHSAGSSEIPLLVWAPEEIPLTPPHVFQGLVHPLPIITSSGSSDSGSDPETTGTYSSERFTPSHQPSSLSTDRVSAESTPTSYASASDESLSSHYFSASDGLVHSPSHHMTSGGSPPSPSSPPTEVAPDNAELFNKSMMKKLKIVAGVAVVVSAIAVIVGATQIKHRDFQDS